MAYLSFLLSSISGFFIDHELELPLTTKNFGANSFPAKLEIGLTVLAKHAPRYGTDPSYVGDVMDVQP